MNVEKIINRITNAGLLCMGGFSDGGPTIKVKIPKENRTVVGLVPIDDKSDDRFADFLISEVRKYGLKNE